MTIEFLNYIYNEIINRSSDEMIGMQIGSGCYRSTLLLNVYRGQSDLAPSMSRIGYLDVNIFTNNKDEYNSINNHSLQLLFGSSHGDCGWDACKIGDVSFISIDKPRPLWPIDSVSNAYLVVTIDEYFLGNSANEVLERALESVSLSIVRVPDCRTIDKNIVVDDRVIGRVQYGQFSDLNTNLPKNNISLVLDLGIPERMLHMEEQMIVKNSLEFAANRIRNCSIRLDHGLHNQVFVTKKSLLPMRIVGDISRLKLSNISENDRNIMEFSNVVLRNMSQVTKQWFANNNVEYSHDPEYIDHQQSFVDAFRFAISWKYGQLGISDIGGQLLYSQQEIFSALDRNAFQEFIIIPLTSVKLENGFDQALIGY